MSLIIQGEAAVIDGGLRCKGPAHDDPTRICNKLVARLNRLGQIAGSFRCDRCKQDIGVQVVAPIRSTLGQ